MERAIVLASGSPRRVELLARMGVSFTVDAADVDEHCEGDARFVVGTLARRKAKAVSERHPGAIILGADTVVECGEILGKPRDEADAARMLRMLSGRWHAVHTGVCALCEGQAHEAVETTRVRFISMSDADIGRYLRSGEPMGKAGAYGIQGMAGMFIDRVEGCPHNVMGLPLAVTNRMLIF